jgi:hypothetical protein
MLLFLRRHNAHGRGTPVMHSFDRHNFSRNADFRSRFALQILCFQKMLLSRRVFEYRQKSINAYDARI